MKKLLLILLVFCTSIVAKAQPFIDEIKAFKHQDSMHFPPKNEILFVGGSSFRLWTDVKKYFPKYPIINRGFGGATLEDLINYAGDIIYPYYPKQTVIYCGENDLAYSDTVTADIVLNRFKKLFERIRNELPNENIVYISIKPSPSRAALIPKMEAANSLILTFLNSQRNAAFVDIFHPMLNPDGTPMKYYFKKDNLHLNARGYAFWQRAIKPYLINPDNIMLMDK